MSDSEDYSEPDAIIIDGDDVSNYNPDNILPKSADEIKRIREWLEPTSYAISGGEFRKHLASHAQGTGQWLTSTEEYEQWLRGEEYGLLWIKGIPGSGKSVHVAKLIDNLGKMNPACPVLFFFFRQIIAANHSPQALVRDWMDQLLRYSPPLQHQLWAYILNEVSLSSLSTGDLLKDLQMAFRALPDKVYCIADALDEMDAGNDDFLQAIGSLGQWRPAKVKVLITSRPVPQVEVPLHQTPALHIRLEERLVDIDISTYVHSVLSESHIPRSAWPVIVNAVPGRANGLFLYAKLAMEAFLEPDGDVETVLAHLPADLNALYTDLLQEHARRSGITPSIQNLILLSVTHATKPLRLLELAEMCRVIDPVGLGKDLRSMKNLIRAACGPLLEILPDETVSVVHHSFTEYLKGATRSEDEGGYPVLQLGSSHAKLALSCLQYLLTTRCLDEVEISIDDSDETEGTGDEPISWMTRIPKDILHLRMKYPFFAYATRNWYVHIQNSDTASYLETGINEVLDQFFSVDTTVKAWLEVTWPGYTSNARKFSALHVAGRYGLVAYAKRLATERSVEVDACDICGKTPLWWAASEGHAATVAELIAAGADPCHERKYDGRQPLHEAAAKNHHTVVKILLEAGVDPLTPIGLTEHEKAMDYIQVGGKRPALALACENGHVESVDAMLPFLDLDAMHRGLSWAAHNGQVAVVRLILAQPGVEVDAVVRGSTALFKACSKRDLATVKTLLEAGADAELLNEMWQDEFGSHSTRDMLKPDGSYALFTCLHALCGGVPDQPISYYDWDDEDGCEMTTLLIEAGADIHRQTENGQTVLHSIVQASYYVARVLLDAGASANAVDAELQTPLYHSRVPACIPLLVEEGGADIDARDLYGNTPLLAALTEHSNEDKILLLLQFGADARVLNPAGDNALHVALKSYYATPRVIQALLESGVEPDARNRQDETALMCSFRSQDAEKIWDLLLEAGADINARDRTGRTIFWHQIAQIQRSKNGEGGGPRDDLRFLLDRGANPHMRDLRGRTCLHEAIKKQPMMSSDIKDSPRVDFLLEIGLNHTLVDHDGNSLLHELAAREREKVGHGRKWVLPLWERLVCTLGLNVDQQNHMGRTPLHIICDVFPEDAERWNDDPGPLDFLLTRMKNVHVPDHAGLTALHIASTRTEYCTRKLLEAGLNPRALTLDGLAPLHLAARAEQSNIVGMLTRLLRKSSSDQRFTLNPKTDTSNDADNGQQHQSKGIDSPDGDGLTPLYHAVRSGRPETVMVLLRAGADANAGCDLFEACAEFEQENAFLDATSRIYRDPLTQRETKREPLEERAVLSPAKSSDDTLSPRDVRRLEEIVQLLVSFGTDTSRLGPTKQPSPSRGIIGDCVWQGKAYTASCLIRNVPKSLWVEPGKSAPYSDFLAISAAAYDPSLASSKSFPQVMAGRQSPSNFQLFMKQRQYTLVKELANRGSRFLPQPRDEFQRSHFAILIQHGFSLLVKSIGKIEAERALGQGDWHAFGDSTKAGLWCAHRPAGEAQAEGKVVLGYRSDFESMPKPFLLEAVQRERPNMTIVRSLVEDFHVDVNERTWGSEYTDHERHLAYDESALHYVAEGFHWWHVHLAMRYLLKRPEVDINFRVKGDLTPLHVAVGGRTVVGKLRPHAYDAAKRLLHAGADVLAMTKTGQGCISLAIHDLQMIRLLIKHGAIISPDDIVTAIEAGQVVVLNELLSAKDADDGEGLDVDLDPALRTAGMLFMKSSPDDQDDIWRPTVDNKIAIQMIKILIDHGANPLSNYIYCPGQGDSIPRPRWRPHLHFKKGVPHTCADPSHREVTLLHELIRDVKDFQIQPFLVPGLEINYRDPQGRTILHAACARADLIEKPLHLPPGSAATGDDGVPEEETLFHRLVALGADLHVRDELGQTILVSLIRPTSWFKPSPRWRATLEAILRLAPELVHEADARGDTPLIHALRVAVGPAADTTTVRRLLSAGASPLVTDSRGEGVLHILAEDLGTPGLRDLFRDLVNRGVNINGRNMTGETPLFKFARRSPQDADRLSDPDYGKRKVRGDEYEDPREQGAVALLEELGADFFARDNEGRGLLHVAAAEGGDVVRFQELMAMGLDPMMENDVQQTAIDVAAACSNDAILEIFEKKVRR